MLLKLVDKVMGLRVSAEAEDSGLDHALHREQGYVFVEHDEPSVLNGKSFVKAPRQTAAAAVKE
jgi:hypothetical protein